MDFLGNIEQEFEANTSRSIVPESPYKKDADISSVMSFQPSQHTHVREDFIKVREKMLELEIEKEEQYKALELVKQLRKKEREEAERKTELMRKEGAKQTDIVK
jgi:hypothetical protein